MKLLKITFAIALSAMMFTACEKEEKNNTIDGKLDSKSKSNILKSSGSIISYRKYQDIVVVLDKSDNEVYFMQTSQNINFSLNSNSSNVYVISNDKLVVENSQSSDIEYPLDSVVFGIGEIGYQSAINMQLIISDGSGGYDINYDEEYYPSVKCGCFRSGTHGQPTNCTSGGEGSTSCSVSSGGESCSISCSGGYNTCCTADENFTYE